MINKNTSLLVTALLSLSTLLFTAQQGKGIVISTKDDVTERTNKSDGNLSIKIKNNKMNLDVRGKVKLSDDDQNIIALSNDGKVVNSIKNMQLEVSPNNEGEIIYRINGKETATLNPAEEELLAECIQTLINQGVYGKERAQRIYKQKGIHAVLTETTNFTSNYTKQIYLSELLLQDISNSDRSKILNNIAQYIESNYYKAEIIGKVMDSALKDNQSFDAYLEVVNNMGSAYYQQQTIQKLFTNNLTDIQFEKVLRITASINSDYHQAEVLSKLLKDNNLNAQKAALIMENLANMDSDYHKAEVLKKMISSSELDVAGWKQTISLTAMIQSDYHQAEVLKTILKKMPADAELNKAVRESAKNIKSNHHYGEIMRQLDN